PVSGASRQNRAQKAYKQSQNAKINGKSCRDRLLKYGQERAAQAAA
ncbi:hypothetical protein, partial [Klebsiella pneumoniae]